MKNKSKTKTARLSIRTHTEKVKKFKSKLALRGVTITEFFDNAIDNFLEK